MSSDASRAVAAEALGTAFLVAAVVGSGIMGERLAAGNAAVALLANTMATGAALVALILTFSPFSGAHFNPVVTLSEMMRARLSSARAGAYVAAQFASAIVGTASAHVMFGMAVFSVSTRVRSGPAQMFSEFVATFGLLAVIQSVSRARATATPFAVAAYITAAYWFTASTSFANPAVTVARSLTDTFSGIRPSDSIGFMAAQVAGAMVATFLFRWFFKS